MKKFKWFFVVLAIAGIGLGTSAFIGKDKAPEKKMVFDTVYFDGGEWTTTDPGGHNDCAGNSKNCRATVTLKSGPGLDAPEDVANQTLAGGSSPFDPSSPGEATSTNTRTVNLNGSVYEVVIQEKA